MSAFVAALLCGANLTGAAFVEAGAADGALVESCATAGEPLANINVAATATVRAVRVR
jgi:hypothetical protein